MTINQSSSEANASNIIFEDEYIIAVNKKAGVLSQSGESKDISIQDILESKAGHKLFILTRLDRPVSGLLLFAKSPEAAAMFSRSLSLEDTNKTYVAIVEKMPHRDAEILEDYLIKHGRKSYITSNYASGKKSIFQYKYLASSTNYHFLKIRLITGRYHQIRAQLANIGCPVLHDVKYGARRSNKEKTIGLHSLRIEINHPVLKKMIKLEAGFPDHLLWHVLKQKNMDI